MSLSIARNVNTSSLSVATHFERNQVDTHEKSYKKHVNEFKERIKMKYTTAGQKQNSGN